MYKAKYYGEFLPFNFLWTLLIIILLRIFIHVFGLEVFSPRGEVPQDEFIR